MSDQWVSKKEYEEGLRQIHARLNSLLAGGVPQPLDTGDGPTFDHLHLTNLLYVGTGGIKERRYYVASLADDASYTLPTMTSTDISVLGYVSCRREYYALFSFNIQDMAVTLMSSAYAVANADTDGKLCVGTAASQNPLQIKNRSGDPRPFFLILWYI